MSKSTGDLTTQYIVAELRRQRYLDFFNENPGKSKPDLEEFMAAQHGDKADSQNTLRKMLALGELSRDGRSGSYRYTANTMVTVAASVMKEMRAKVVVPYVVPAKSAAGMTGPYYRHQPGRTENSGGQGALRDRVWPGTSGRLNW